MKRTFLLAVALWAFSGLVRAGPTNLSFEDGLKDWIVVPDGGPVTAVGSHEDSDGTGTTYWEPYSGNNMALLKTASQGQWVELYQVFSADAGEVLEIVYFWDSGDSKDSGDQASGLLTGPGIGTVSLFYESTVNDPDDGWGTPWKVVRYTLPSAGRYTLEFRIMNGNQENDSYLGIDAVPSPAAILLVGLGTALTGWIRLRRVLV